MKEATKRWILRWIHIVFSIPILGYIYSPFEEIPKYASRVVNVGKSRSSIKYNLLSLKRLA